LCSPGPLARSCINGKEIKINKVEYFNDSPLYKCIVGAVLKKDSSGFLVKTSDSFIKVTEFEYDGKLRVGDRFDFK
jgi:methionyl-tRNA formyltransferase